MLKRIVILAALIASPAAAQQAPPAQDPALSAYAQLLSEANGRVAALSAQLQQANQAKANLDARLGDLQKQVDAAKPKADPTPSGPSK